MLNRLNRLNGLRLAGATMRDSMRRHFKLTAALLLFVAIVAVALLIVTDATLVFTIVAAIAASAGVWLTARGNQQQKQLANDIHLLAELTEGSLEEARAQRPEPVVRLAVGDGEPATSARLNRVWIARPVEVERIIEQERRRHSPPYHARSRRKPSRGRPPQAKSSAR